MSYPRYQMTGEAQAPGGADLHQRVSEKLDQLFTQYLSIYEQIREKRHEANAQMKEGFFKLSESRHSLPTVGFDSSAYSGREMLPTHYARILAVDPADEKRSEDGARVLEIDGLVKFELANVDLKEEKEDEQGEEEDEEESKESTGVRQRTGKGNDAARAAAPAATSSDAANVDDDAPVQPVTLDLRQSPLQWFGALSPPSLSLAADSFHASLTPLLSIASLTQELETIQRKFRYLGQLQQASHVDPAVEDELREILDKIRISDEKKASATQGSDETANAEAAITTAATTDAAAVTTKADEVATAAVAAVEAGSE